MHIGKHLKLWDYPFRAENYLFLRSDLPLLWIARSSLRVRTFLIWLNRKTDLGQNFGPHKLWRTQLEDKNVDSKVWRNFKKFTMQTLQYRFRGSDSGRSGISSFWDPKKSLFWLSKSMERFNPNGHQWDHWNWTKIFKVNFHYEFFFKLLKVDCLVAECDVRGTDNKLNIMQFIYAVLIARIAGRGWPERLGSMQSLLETQWRAHSGRPGGRNSEAINRSSDCSLGRLTYSHSNLQFVSRIVSPQSSLGVQRLEPGFRRFRAERIPAVWRRLAPCQSPKVWISKFEFPSLSLWVRVSAGGRFNGDQAGGPKRAPKFQSNLKIRF